MSEIENILGQLGIQHKKEESGEIRVNCPYCQDPKYHLYVNPVEKVFFCQKCGAKGTWSQLMKELRPSITPLSRDKRPVSHPDMEYIKGCHKRLMGPSGTKAIEYLYSRKFSIEAIQDFYLGLEAKNGMDWLVIPYFKDGKPVNAKYRTLPPAEKGFRRWTGGESSLFNQDCLKEDHTEFGPVKQGKTEINCGCVKGIDRAFDLYKQRGIGIRPLGSQYEPSGDVLVDAVIPKLVGIREG